MSGAAKSPEHTEKKDPKPLPKKVQAAIDRAIDRREKTLRELEKH